MISVCLATYNGEMYLKEQIVSILKQLGPDDELIISDDCSTDKTHSIIDSFDDPRIKFFINNSRHGVIGNFENALNNAKGDIIFLADQDDVWTSYKVRECVDALKNNDCIMHDAFITDARLNHTGKTLYDTYSIKKGVVNNIIRNSFTGACMAFKRDVLNKALPFPKNDSFYHDQWIGLIAELKYKTAFIEKPLIYFRRHVNNSSSAADKSRLSFIQKLSYRISLLRNILQRL